jgi:hypothetical protein
MEHGNISNRVAPRWLFQFERLIATPPTGPRQVRFRLGRRSRERWALEGWEVKPHTSKVLWDLYWRQDYRFDVFTLDDDLYDADIMLWLEQYGLPFGHLLRFPNADALAKQTVYMPDVLRVVHSEPEAQMKFGGKGMYVPVDRDGWTVWDY